jgi:hypothetical protein
MEAWNSERSVNMLTRSGDSGGEMRGNVLPFRGNRRQEDRQNATPVETDFLNMLAVTIKNGAFEVASWQVGWKVWILNRVEVYTLQRAGHPSATLRLDRELESMHSLAQHSRGQPYFSIYCITTCLLAISIPRTPQLVLPTSECLSSHLACGIVSNLHGALFEHMVR